MKSRLAVSIALSIIMAASLAVKADRGPSWRSFTSQAMGKTGVAEEEGTGALFLNPSLLQKNEGFDFQLYGDLGLNEVLFDYAAWVADNHQYFNSLDSLLDRIEPIDNKWAPFAQSVVLGGSYDQYSLAMVLDLRYDLTLAKAVLTPVPGVGASSDLVLAFGRGFLLPQDYRLGVTARYLHRSVLPRQLIGITDDRFFKVYNTLKKENDGLATTWEKISVAADLAENQHGAGLNVGVSRDIQPHWTVGASVQDFPAMLGGEMLRPQLNVGVAYGRNSAALEGLITRFTGSFDWQDYLIPGTPWFKQFKAGLGARGYLEKKTAAGKSELGREVFFVGLGASDGYPSVGVRFGYFLYLSYAYTVSETGTYPGQRPLAFHKFGLDLSI